MADRSRDHLVDDEERDREAVKSILPSDDNSGDFHYSYDQGNGLKSERKGEECVDLGSRCSRDDNNFSENLNNSSLHTGDAHKKDHETRNYNSPQFYQDSESKVQEPLTTRYPIPAKSQELNEKSNAQEVSVEASTLCDLVAAHYNNVPKYGLDERSKSRILHLRNFNNWIKSMLIDEFITKVRDSKPRGSGLKVLDMGCGKGGDLFKWRQGKISHLVCTDIAAISVDQCKDRYNDTKQRAQCERNFSPLFSAEFIVANCTKERLREHYADVTLQLDLVSCQFAFHYCFESLPQAECMMRNAAECLRPGGYFFGTCPNANAIVSRARKAGGKKFGNEVYSIEFETPIEDSAPPPTFGAKYNFHMDGVVDCPEFLVHFPTLIRLASRFDLEFVVCEPFHSFFDRKKEPGRALLGKMQSLETYPPFPDQTLMGPLPQYEHAEAYLKGNTSSSKLGTLSQAEWEAATLYLIFVFQKASSPST